MLESLTTMLRVLRYPIGFFINIGSLITHADLVPEEAHGRIVFFAVSLVAGKTLVVENRA